MFLRLLVFALGILFLISGVVSLSHPIPDVRIALRVAMTVTMIIVGSMWFGWGLYCIIYEAVRDALKK